MTSTSGPRAVPPADLLMLGGTVAGCADCGDERLFVPVDEPDAAGEFCCTTCDAAVLLLGLLEAPPTSRSRRAA